MPKRPESLEDQPLAVDPELSERELEAYEEIERLRSETGAGGLHFVLVFKRSADGARWERVKLFPADRLNLDELPTLYGGGEYLLRLLNDRKAYIKQQRISYPTDVYPRTPAAAVAAVAAALTPATAGDGAMRELLAEIQRMRQDSEARSAKLMETLLTTMVANMKPVSLADTLAQLTALKSLAGDNPKAPADLISSVMKEGIALGRAVAGGGTVDGDEEGGANVARIVEKGIDTFMKLLEARKANPPAKPATAAPRAVPAGASAPVPSRLPEHLRPYAWLAQYAPTVITYAGQGVPADRLAGAIYDMVPETHVAELEDFVRLEAPQRRELLAQLDGRLAPYLDYMDEIAAHLIKIFDTDGDDEGNDDAEPDAPGSAVPA